MTKLKGKVAVITGGSSGIGPARAKRFVEEGAYVFITGRRQTELDTTELKDRRVRTNVISLGARDTPIIDSQVNSKQAAEKIESGVRLADTTRPDGLAGRDCVSGPFLGFGRKQLRSGD